MKFYLVKLLTNTQGQDAPSINVYPTREAALIAYHQTLASYHNADDVDFAVVEVLDEYGSVEISEIVNHRRAPGE